MSALADWAAGDGETLTWLDLSPYAHAVFTGSSPRWYDEPATVAAAVGQAQRLLRSQVLSVDLVGSFGLIERPGAAPRAGSLEQVGEVLADEGRRSLATQTVEALAHGSRGADLMLVLPSPARLLDTAGADVDAMDDVAAALVAVLRSMADRPVAGIVVDCDGPPDDAEIESWSSLLGAARHYRWTSAVRLPAVRAPGDVAGGIASDLVLLPSAQPASLHGQRRCGGGLTDAVWADGSDGDAAAVAAATCAFAYGVIPATATPETVLRRVEMLCRSS